MTATCTETVQHQVRVVIWIMHGKGCNISARNMHGCRATSALQPCTPVGATQDNRNYLRSALTSPELRHNGQPNPSCTACKTVESLYRNLTANHLNQSSRRRNQLTARADSRGAAVSAEQWEMGYDCRGDYLAGEPPGGSPYPSEAPYPREWTPEQRLAMSWYAHDNNIRVDYDPRAEDEGTAGWYAAANAMGRNGRWQRAQVAAIRDSIRVADTDGQLPLETPPTEPPPEPSDPSEPRYPNPANLVTAAAANPMESW